MGCCEDLSGHLSSPGEHSFSWVEGPVSVQEFSSHHLHEGSLSSISLVPEDLISLLTSMGTSTQVYTLTQRDTHNCTES